MLILFNLCKIFVGLAAEREFNEGISRNVNVDNDFTVKRDAHFRSVAKAFKRLISESVRRVSTVFVNLNENERAIVEAERGKSRILGENESGVITVFTVAECKSIARVGRLKYLRCV